MPKRFNSPPPRSIRPWRVVAGHWTLLAKFSGGLCVECKRRHIRTGMRIVKAGPRVWSAWQCVRKREVGSAPRVDINPRLRAVLEAVLLRNRGTIE